MSRALSLKLLLDSAHFGLQNKAIAVFFLFFFFFLSFKYEKLEWKKLAKLHICFLIFCCALCRTVSIYHFWLNKLGQSVVFARRHLSKWRHSKESGGRVSSPPGSLILKYSADDMHTVATETKSQFVQSRAQKRCRERPLLEEDRLWCICLRLRSLLWRCSGLSLFISFQLRRGGTN